MSRPPTREAAGGVVMSRILNRPVRVDVTHTGRPVAFRWEGRWHRVADILDEWVYREPWWERALVPGQGPGRAPERTFYRIAAEGGAVMELVYRDPEGEWRLYRTYD